jgi:alkyl hydroperoxide reductase subunit AhpC
LCLYGAQAGFHINFQLEQQELLLGMLTVGELFPAFSLTATVSTDKKNAFQTITHEDYPGKWKVYFFWPKDFTFVCPTEIAEFARMNKEFEDRDAV